jgi:hypothetical protein
LKRSDLRVLHAYGAEPVEVAGTKVKELMTSFKVFLDGDAQPCASFRVADFRDDDPHVLLVVEESC